MENAQARTIPQIIKLLSGINFEKLFSNQEKIKINYLYRILTSDLSVDITVGDLKNLNRYMVSVNS